MTQNPAQVFILIATKRVIQVHPRGLSPHPPSVASKTETRFSFDPLGPINGPAWLVTRDRYSEIVSVTELAAGANLRAALTAARDAKVAEGWAADAISPSVSFFFCARDGDRVLVGTERRDPNPPPALQTFV